MLQTGDRAPDFTLLDQRGDDCSLSAYLAEGSVVLYFYPIDFSPVCTAQACAMRDEYDGATIEGIKIVGVSPQSVESHARFAKTHNLQFPLLADPKKQVIRAYGVDGMFGMGTRRATFLIETDGIIANRVVSDLFVGPHKQFLQEVVGG